MTQSKGKLIISGGAEEEDGNQAILNQVIRLLHGDGMLLVLTVATEHPEETAKGYRQVFKDRGVKNIEWLDIRMREDGLKRENIDKVKQAALLFFTGGDQLRITSQMGDTPIYSTIHERFQKGMHIFGTSAGAAVVPETMIIGGESEKSNKIHRVSMGPGLGLISGVIVDSHFAERGRIGRLLGAVAHNPTNLGLGIDENTAIVIDKNREFRVIGDGAAYVVDGSGMTYSSLSESDAEGILSIHDMKLHVLGEGKKFDLKTRRPILEDELETTESPK